MQILDMGTKVYVTATVVGVTVGADGNIVYRVNIPGLGNFNCPIRHMNEITEKKVTEGDWQKMKVGDRDTLICSNCHQDSGSIRPTKYCPECGAYMLGPKTDKENK